MSAKLKSERKMETPAPAGRPDEFKTIARKEVFPDPDQPRKTFTLASLEELAESIKQQGIVQPLIVRLQLPRYKIHPPDLMSDKWRVTDGTEGANEWKFESEAKAKNFVPGDESLLPRYVIVAGERRWRASELAGLTELPCIVRDMDARRVFAQQIIENNQREGVSAIEEARALDREFARRKAESLDFKKEDFAKELGMSRADFYGTLVLTRLHKPVEAALLAGKISASQAKVIAMVPLPKQQEKLLELHEERLQWGDGMSVRDMLSEIERSLVKQLKNAPFDTKARMPGSNKFPPELQDALSAVKGADPTIISCEECPYRTGNMVDGYPDLKARPNVCTHVQCFELKCKEHYAQVAKVAEAKGKPVMTQGEFSKIKDGYVAGDMTVQANNLNWGDDMEKAMGRYKPEPVLVRTPKGLRKFYPREEALAAAKKNGTKFYDSQVTKLETPEAKAKREEKEKHAKALGGRIEAFVETQWPILAALLPKLKSETAWRAGALLAEHMEGYGEHAVEKVLIHPQKTDQGKVLAKLFADGANSPTEGYEATTWTDEESVFQAWKLAGIDLKAAFDASEKGAQTKLSLPKKKAKQGELLGGGIRLR